MLLALLTQQMGRVSTPAKRPGSAPPYIVDPIESWVDPRLWEVNRPRKVLVGATGFTETRANVVALTYLGAAAIGTASSAGYISALRRTTLAATSRVVSAGDVAADTHNPARDFNKRVLLAEIDEDLLTCS